MLETSRLLARRVRRSVFVFPIIVLAGLALLAISELSYQRARASLDEIGTIGRTRTALQSLHRLMLDAETGQRGYLLTGRKEYLVPYREAGEELQATLKTLREHGAGGAPSEGLAQLELLVQRKMSELGTTLDLYDQGREQAWRTMLSTDIGKEQMDQIRALSEQLLAQETTRGTNGRRDVYDTLQRNRLGVGAMTVLGVLVLFVFLRQAAALEREREAQRARVQAERDHLDVEVQRRTAQLAELAQHLQTAREDERSRLARELHDELGALLTAAKLDAARLKSRIATLGPEALERLAHLNESLNSGIALKRRIIEDLRPSALANLGLVPALEILTREYAQSSGIEVDTRLEPVTLDPVAELTVYRIVQEALTNIGKHARAQRVDVVLEPAGPLARIRVADDGVGFDTATSRSSSHGLLGMNFRVEAVGGRLRIDSSPQRGTRIEAELPQQQPTGA